MSPKRVSPQGAGPSPIEIRLRSDLDRARRELEKLKKEIAASGAAKPPAPGSAGVPPPAVPAAPLAASAEPAGAASDDELAHLRQQISELTETRQRLSRLYFSQLEENKKRAQKLHQVLENICQINSTLDLDSLLQRLSETISSTLGFRVVLIRLRDPETNCLRACAFTGIEGPARTSLEAEDVKLEDFLSWLHDEFKVGHSYFISHAHAFNKTLPTGYTPDLGEREEWEWHEEDVLLVPLFNRTGDLVAYFSVDDPVDRLVPSSETIELLEIFGNHAVVAIENARLYRQLESHTRELEEAGRRMQEMHALKSNFVSTVSHELRTPLTAIRAYVDTLIASREGEISHEQQQHFLSIVNEESHRLARLIESVLDLNRFDSGTMRMARQPVDLAELVEESRGLLQPMAQAGQVTLKLESKAADTRVDADRDQLRQLVLHLGSNAVKFTPAGGSVTFRLLGDARDFTLQVEDTGIGIPEQALERVFERFYQVDSSLVRQYGGTGLGLAICKSIVDWHGGRIHAESTPGRGSRFTVVLPRRTGPRITVRPGSRTRPETEDVLKLAIEMVAEVMTARVVSLLAPEPDGDLRIQAAVGLDEVVVREARIKPGSGVAGWVALNGRPVCVADPDDRRDVSGSGRGHYRTGTFLSVPLEGSVGLLGVLNVTDPISSKPFDAEDCHLLLHLADRVAAAWERAQSMEQSQAEVEGTARALRQVLQHLERSRRSAPDRVRLARATARKLGLSEAETGVVSFAASIHDVGMTQMGESILEGGGTLSAEGREAIERHCELGIELLRPLETLGVVRDVILSHHEWWDGSGYPRGLSGQEIPIGGRILAVVDAWESMIIGRAHRSAKSKEEALEELRRLTGQQFDPDVIAAFEPALAELEQQNLATAPQPGDGAAIQGRR